MKLLLAGRVCVHGLQLAETLGWHQPLRQMDETTFARQSGRLITTWFAPHRCQHSRQAVAAVPRIQDLRVPFTGRFRADFLSGMCYLQERTTA